MKQEASTIGCNAHATSRRVQPSGKRSQLSSHQRQSCRIAQDSSVSSLLSFLYMAFLPKNFSFPQVIKSLSARMLSTLAPFLKPRVLQRTCLRYLQLGPTAATYFVDFSSSRAMSIVFTLSSMALSGLPRPGI